ncbi:NADH-FMN oxidoreductase RutF, flavin reductase (DIM6/NTAB) family [Prauserella aidingensis]|uniref:flavin reductase family protein n=1 Tax=Prauserella aidingensis TaxID=387890 RepID=UPI0020A50CC8|nr:flavin reductase family protein [Prauserella aidingensis]MCP2256141.1 NADH-FMN oxidoreductase RutF, flavin reductase (DIM6/NTAB) family [Prauserella aidingensis]
MDNEVGKLSVPAQQDLQTAFRDVMAAVCTPVSVVTAMAGDHPHGTTVSAFASLSMNPPMVLVSLDRASNLLAIARDTRLFGLNVLSSDQSALAANFTRKGESKFAGIEWETVAGVPQLPGVCGFVACEVTELVNGGDHVVLLGHVQAAEPAGGRPLTYHARVFGTHSALQEAST